MAASARIRDPSAAVFAEAALFSTEGAIFLSLDTLPLFMWELSALAMALRKSVICFSGNACDRDNWSRYALATTKVEGHSIFCWFCTFSSASLTALAASISFCVREGVGV